MHWGGLCKAERMADGDLSYKSSGLLPDRLEGYFCAGRRMLWQSAQIMSVEEAGWRSGTLPGAKYGEHAYLRGLKSVTAAICTVHP